MEIKQAFKYCPRCGTEFKKESKYLHCPACGLDYYLNPKPATTVVLQNDHGEYIFAVRADEPRKGYLDFIGGFVDDNEDFEEAAKREIKEETGLIVGPLEFLGTHTNEYLFQGINYKTVEVAYLAKIPVGAEFRVGDDVEKIMFYKADEIPLKHLAWPFMKKIVSQLK